MHTQTNDNVFEIGRHEPYKHGLEKQALYTLVVVVVVVVVVKLVVLGVVVVVVKEVVIMRNSSHLGPVWYGPHTQAYGGLTLAWFIGMQVAELKQGFDAHALRAVVVNCVVVVIKWIGTLHNWPVYPGAQ